MNRDMVKGTTAAGKQNSANDVLDHLRLVLNRLNDLDQRMGDRLAPIMNPEYPVELKKCDKIAYPPYFEEISSLADKMECSIDHMNMYLDRTEI